MGRVQTFRGIKGLTSELVGRPSIVGMLYKGAPKTEPKRPGKDLSYFRFSERMAGAQRVWDEKFPKEPRSIRAYLPFPKPQENFRVARELYGASGLVHRCDGETMYLWRDETGRMRTDFAPCPYREGGEKMRTQKDPGCKQTGYLDLFIPELWGEGYVGIVTLITHSKWDIIGLTESILYAYEQRVARNLGDLGLQFLLFDIRREMREVSTPVEGGGRVRTKKWMLVMHSDPEWAKFQLQLAQHRMDLMLASGVTPVPMLPSVSLAGGVDFEDATDTGGDDEWEDDAAAQAEAERMAGAAGCEEALDGEYSEYEEADQTESEQKPPATATQTAGGDGNGNGNGNNGDKAQTRPYAPEVVKSRIAATVKSSPQLAHKLPDPKQVGLLAGKMAEALGDGDAGTQGRHLALQFLFGKKSSNDLDAAEVNAGLRWLVGQRDETGHYTIYDLSAEELKRIVAQASVVEGQAKLL